MKISSALKVIVALLVVAGSAGLPRAAGAQNLWTFANVQVYNDWNDTVVVCWIPDCISTVTLLFPGRVTTLTGVSSVWATRRSSGLRWPTSTVWQNPQACILHQNNGYLYPQWTCGVPQPPGAAEAEKPLTRAQFTAWARTLRDKVSPDAELALPQQELPPSVRQLIEQAPSRPKK